MKRPPTLGLLLPFLAAVLLFSCAEAVETPPPEPRPVRFQQVYATGGARIRTFTGAAKAGIESKISFKVPGTVQALHVNMGDIVREGDRIAELDPRDYELQVEEAEASLAQARAQAVNAEASFRRIRGLYERNNASQADYDAARANQDSARAQVNAIQKRLEGARLQLSYTKLTSPTDGAVAERNVEINENVQAGQPIAILNAGAEPEVEVAIPEVLIREIRQGARVEVTFDALPDRTFSGRVTEVAVAAAQGLTTYPVTIRLSRADPRILPGMAAEVGFRFGVEGEETRWIVPPHSVVEDRQGRFVYVVNAQDNGLGQVERRKVVVGELVSDGLEILQGLKDGERVVTAGVSQIEDGLEVKLLDQDEG